MTAFSAEEILEKSYGKYIGISVKRAHINLWALDFHCIFYGIQTENNALFC